jgi:hypothetical protein
VSCLQGQLVLPNGVAWQQHLLVLMVSAKLLADAEAAMQTHGDTAGGKQKRIGTGEQTETAAATQCMDSGHSAPSQHKRRSSSCVLF